MRTRIDNGTVIAWRDGRHVVLDTGVVVFSGTTIEFVGERYDDPSDRSIDAAGRLVIPGLVDAHLHVTDTPYTKGYLEEVGASRAGMAQNFAALYRILPAVRAATDPDSQVAAAACAFAELARTGSTTVVELGYPFKFLVHAAGGGDVERVIVDGATIVENGEVLTIDVPEVVRQVNEASGSVRAKLDL